MLEQSSSLKVPYDIRPAKQVERRMLLELYRRLGTVGFPIESYHYVAFGSIFFYDFKLMHKFLGVSRLTSIEGFEDIWQRCEFNKPFKAVELFKGLSTECLSAISPEEKHLFWLYYDRALDGLVCSDILTVVSSSTPGTLLIVTIDLEDPEGIEDDSPGG